MSSVRGLSLEALNFGLFFFPGIGQGFDVGEFFSVPTFSWRLSLVVIHYFLVEWRETFPSGRSLFDSKYHRLVGVLIAPQMKPII